MLWFAQGIEQFGKPAHPEFAHEARPIHFYSSGAQRQAQSDLFVHEPARNPGGHVSFARREKHLAAPWVRHSRDPP